MKIERVAELDALRFLAAVSVALFHLVLLPTVDGAFEQGLKDVTRFGFFGVPLFFMISGFVILWTAQGKDAAGFLISRAARLYPSFWVAVLLAAASWLMLAGRPFPVATIFANLTMIPSPLGFQYVDGVYWTLLIEIKFYALVFALILARQIKRAEHWLTVWLAAQALAHFWRPDWLVAVTLEGYGNFFVSGAFFYLCRSQGPSVLRLGLLAISMLLCAASATELQDGYTHFHSWQAHATTAVLTVLAHAAFLPIALTRWKLPSFPLWFTLGACTYPLYLLHNVPGALLYLALGLDDSQWLKLALVLAVISAAAFVMSKYIERRACRKFGQLLEQLRSRIARRPVPDGSTAVTEAPLRLGQ